MSPNSAPVPVKTDVYLGPGTTRMTMILQMPKIQRDTRYKPHIAFTTQTHVPTTPPVESATNKIPDWPVIEVLIASD